MSDIEPKKDIKKRKWVRKWEEHNHCNVCGLAVEVNKEYCGSVCESKYLRWQAKRKKKEKIYCYVMIVIMVVFVVIMIVPMLF